MNAKIFGPRKRRTRQHVIADLSVHHVEGAILEEGHTTLRVFSDYGIDLVMYTFDELGFAEPGLIFLQLKAAEELRESGSECVFDLDVRDYNLWTLEESPVILILYDASNRRAFWLHVQEYFRADPARGPKKGAKTIRVRIPLTQRWNRHAVSLIRQLKTKSVD